MSSCGAVGSVRARYLVFFQYLGTDFNGVAAVRGNHRAVGVQNFLEEAAKRLNSVEPVRFTISSRTDAGVHALSNAAHLDIHRRSGLSPYSPEVVAQALNTHLKHRAIRVLKAFRVPNNFHARHAATSRTYLYRLATGCPWPDQLPVFEQNVCWALQTTCLDVAAMQEAAQHLLGTHDFSAFQSAGSPATNTVRTLQRVSVSSGPASPFVLPQESSPCWKMDGPETEFNLKVVLVSFKQCLTEEGEVLLDHYIASWKGLVRFLNSLGAVFSFISKDVVSKLQIMEHLRNSPQYEHYTSLQSMVAYEVGNKLVDIDRRSRSRYPNSGCRTVLRLHRALHWLRLFLEGLHTSPEDARTSTLCSDAYNATLAAYHSWIIRQAVTVAFCALPTRKVFLEAMNVGSSEQAVEMLGEALPFIEHVYDISQKLYAEHSLLDLP
ncbi:glycolipid transfer protein domain-containing protein 2 isoform X2 [Peromyscus californicus insignis]|uniref:glycolipid transfer protein domain-containing protein 2 isoform X2 n=1 Tax=Peromyscus californicus insignis TaxID=564181 RepID=UPI0022A70E2B|nr:glycolipid transfer protein domain-containing protein 2 isoform X2 [Peromyscus californicus insignis]